MKLQERLNSKSAVRYDPASFENWLSEAFADNVRIIKDNKRREYYNVACSFDIETSSFTDERGNKQACMYLWGFCVNGLCMYGRTWQEWQQLTTQLAELLELSDTRALIIYVHNLAYEFQFMRHWFEWYKVFSIDQRKPARAVDQQGIEYRCSYILSGYSLAKLGSELQHYKIKKLVGSLDYSKLRHSETPITDDELQYQINDVKVVAAYIQECIEQERYISNIPLTKTGYVRRYVRRECLYTPGKKRGRRDNKKFHRYRKLMQGCTLDADEYAQLKAGFQGGFTHANAFYTGRVVPRVASYDFTSSYPAQMVAQKYPMSKAELIEIKSEAAAEDQMQMYCCLFDVKITGLQPRILWDHPLSRSKCYMVKGCYEDNGRIVQADELYTTLTEQDYYTLKDFYSWDHITFGTFRRYMRQYLPRDFLRAILKLYQDKTQLKGVAGKEVEYTLAKGMLNACYGMAVTDIVKPEIVYNNEWIEPQPLGPDEVQKVLNVYNRNIRRFLFYPWGVWVTAYARRALFSGIKAFGADYIYSDTDSIKCINHEKHRPYIMAYNADITEKLKKTCRFYGFDVRSIAPQTIKGIKKPLGVWDFEGVYDHFKTLGAKRYMTEENGTLSITVAGVNKKAAVPYLHRRYGDNMAVFEAFDDGLYFPPEATGKNIHTYIDDPMQGVITDYTGKAGEYYELSGVHLGPADYSLSISRAYSDYLKGVQYE